MQKKKLRIAWNNGKSGQMNMYNQSLSGFGIWSLTN